MPAPPAKPAGPSAEQESTSFSGLALERDPEAIAQHLLNEFDAPRIALIIRKVLTVHPAILDEFYPCGYGYSSCSSPSRRRLDRDVPNAEMLEVAEAVVKDLTPQKGLSRAGTPISEAPTPEAPTAEAIPKPVHHNSRGGYGLGVSPPRRRAKPIEPPEAIASTVPSSPSVKAGHSPTLLMFACSIYYAAESDGFVDIDVIRMGNASQPCSVAYRTYDHSAKAGIKYIPVEGVLELQAGELSKDIRITIIDDDTWDATLEFGLELSDAKGASLGDFLDSCRVKIIDNDTFPTNRFHDLCVNLNFHEIPRVSQLLEYCKMNWSIKEIQRGTKIYLFFDMLDNLYRIWFLLLRLYLVDSVLNVDSDEVEVGTTLQLCLAGLVTFGTQVASFMQERGRIEMRVGGKARTLLQKNILRKFLNYEESMRSMVKESDMIVSINTDCPTLVHEGYFVVIKLIKECELLTMIFIYQLVVALTKSDIDAASIVFVLLPGFLLPVALLIFFKHRESIETEKLLKRDLARNMLARCVEMVVQNFRLIMDFSKRGAMIEECDGYVQQVNDATVEADKVHIVNKYFAPMVTFFLIGIYIIVGGQMTISGQLSIGHFLTNLDVYYEMCTSWMQFYEELLIINAALPALEQVTRYLNLPIDLDKRRIANERRRATNLEARVKAREELAAKKKTGAASAENVLYASDTIPIVLTNVSFQYTILDEHESIHGQVMRSVSNMWKDHSEMSSHDKLRSVLIRIKGYYGQLHRRLSGERKQGTKDEEDVADTNGNGSNGRMKRASVVMTKSHHMENWCLTIPQGKMIALIGDHGSGKGTLLKVVGGVLLPSTGDFFSPPQLRVFYVTQEPLFFYAGLFDNLTFGLSAAEKKMSGTVTRVEQICSWLGVDHYVMRMLPSSTKRDWLKTLPLSQLKRLHVARALIANPEVLVMEKPACGFDHPTAERILNLLRKHVMERGLVVEEDRKFKMRPRTLLFTTERPEACDIADIVFNVTLNGVHQMDEAAIQVARKHLLSESYGDEFMTGQVSPDDQESKTSSKEEPIPGVSEGSEFMIGQVSQDGQESMWNSKTVMVGQVSSDGQASRTSSKDTGSTHVELFAPSTRDGSNEIKQSGIMWRLNSGVDYQKLAKVADIRNWRQRDYSLKKCESGKIELAYTSEDGKGALQTDAMLRMKAGAKAAKFSESPVVELAPISAELRIDAAKNIFQYDVALHQENSRYRSAAEYAVEIPKMLYPILFVWTDEQKAVQQTVVATVTKSERDTWMVILKNALAVR